MLSDVTQVKPAVLASIFLASFVEGMVKKQGLLRMCFECIDLELNL